MGRGVHSSVGPIDRWKWKVTNPEAPSVRFISVLEVSWSLAKQDDLQCPNTPEQWVKAGAKLGCGCWGWGGGEGGQQGRDQTPPVCVLSGKDAFLSWLSDSTHQHLSSWPDYPSLKAPKGQLAHPEPCATCPSYEGGH